MPINTHLIFSLKAECAEPLQEWINYQQSLTERLQKFKGEAQLELLSQEWIHTDLWSKSLLELQDSTVFQREIMMKSHGLAYWYARSIIPEQCYKLDSDFFDRLKKESIKNLIFNDSRVQRIQAINYPVNNQCVEFYWVKKYLDAAQGTLWVRIAEFSFLQSKSFYLVEIMLPQLGEVI